MSDKYKYMFLNYLYKKLNLKEIEKIYIQNEINHIDVEVEGLYTDISKYFSLVNKVDESRLTEDQMKQYNYYFSLPIEKLLSDELLNKVLKFIESTYKIMLFPNIEENHCFYGPLNYKYLAPRDCVVLGLNYYEFDINSDDFDKTHSKREAIICDTLNYIQEELANSIGMNIAVLRYNEYSKKKFR